MLNYIRCDQVNGKTSSSKNIKAKKTPIDKQRAELLNSSKHKIRPINGKSQRLFKTDV